MKNPLFVLDVMKEWGLSWMQGKPKKVGEVPYYGVLNDKQIQQLAHKKHFIAPFQPENVKAVTVAGNCAICGGSKGRVFFDDDVCDACEGTGAGLHSALSFGTSSYGYDFTLAEDVHLFVNHDGRVIDVKDFDLDVHTELLEVKQDYKGRYVILPPHSFVLAHTVEYVRMPDDVVGLCFDKSTYARIGGIQTNVTPIEPGWQGQITLEIRNTLPSFARLYVGEGIIQTVFFRGMRPAITYAEKQGKYQGQQGVTGAIV